MTTWRLLKRDDEPHDKCWIEVGTHESERDWTLGIDAATEIGEYHGAGEYLLITGSRSKPLTIAERREFYEVDTSPPMTAAEIVEATGGSLKAAPSAAEIMERDG